MERGVQQCTGRITRSSGFTERVQHRRTGIVVRQMLLDG
jgi:hypothetical protein